MNLRKKIGTLLIASLTVAMGIGFTLVPIMGSKADDVDLSEALGSIGVVMDFGSPSSEIFQSFGEEMTYIQLPSINSVDGVDVIISSEEDVRLVLKAIATLDEVSGFGLSIDSNVMDAIRADESLYAYFVSGHRDLTRDAREASLRELFYTLDEQELSELLNLRPDLISELVNLGLMEP